MSNHCRPPRIVYVSHPVTLPPAPQTFSPELNSQMRKLQTWKADYPVRRGGSARLSVPTGFAADNAGALGSHALTPALRSKYEDP